MCGLLLAGGQSRRMGGGDKCLAELGGKTLLRRIVDIAAPQAGPLVLNANGDPARFASYGLPVAPDVVEGFAGPLAGILTGLEWAREHAPECVWVASFACDAPFVPPDLVGRLFAAVEAEGADLACAASGGRDHPVFGLWPVSLAGDLRRALVDEGVRKVDIWTNRYRLACAEFAFDRVDPFFNVNSPDDLARAEALLAARRRGELQAMDRKTKPRLRVLLGDAIAMGPGKAELLDRIGTTGSISAAAREMGMSYRRAWSLVETMNATFREPVVTAATGGRGGGGAEVTEFGREALRQYREMEAKAADSVSGEMDAFSELLSPEFERDETA